MRSKGNAVLLAVALSASLSAQQADKAQLPRSQMPDLGRPTKSNDPLPVFNFGQYFLGKWTFEWDVPDSPLGPAGTIRGTTVFKALDEGFFEANTDASGPAGPIKIKDAFAYRPESKTIARNVTDSRGFSYMQIGPIGGDLGGYYTIYFDSAPFVVNGKTIRFRTTMRLVSPVHYKVESRLSVDGGPFVNFGIPWWEKDATSPSRHH